MPDTIVLTMITRRPLKTAEGLGRLLDAMESVPECAPTHWGPDERARNPYDRTEMADAVTGYPSEFFIPGFRRNKPVRYQGYFSAKNKGLKDVKLDFGTSLRKKNLPQIFSLGAALAEGLEPEVGFVHPIWRLGEASQHYSASGILKSSDLQACGPKPICARTWYGRHIVDLIGRDRIDRAGIPVMETSWGGVMLDLIESPWDSDFPVISEKQAAVMSVLEASNVFGDYSDTFNCRPNSNWMPIPE